MKMKYRSHRYTTYTELGLEMGTNIVNRKVSQCDDAYVY